MRLSIEEQPHVALPKLMGAPAYARPPRQVDEPERPFDPDDLPITAYQTADERRLLETLPAEAYAPGGVVLHGQDRQELHARPFRLRALGKLLRGN